MSRPDPRAEPESVPPERIDDTAGALKQLSVDRVRTDVVAKRTSDPPPAQDEPPPSRPKVLDPRYESIEKLLDRNDWRGISAELGELAEIAKVPPNLGLIAALAHNEATQAGHPEAVATATRCMAAILGVEESSPIARVLARRMLRKNPTRLRDRKAPPAKVSFLVVFVALVLGVGVGWLAFMGNLRALPGMFRSR